MKQELSSHDFEKVVLGAGQVVGDQDGPPERALKSRLAPILDRYDEITAAYLVAVSFEEGAEHRVMLCLVSTAGPNEQAVRDISAVFKELFTSDTQMDILFLSPRDEAGVAGNCRAFFDRRTPAGGITGLSSSGDEARP